MTAWHFFEVQGEETSVSVQAAMANAAVAKVAHNIRILCRSAWDFWLRDTQAQAAGSSSRNKKAKADTSKVRPIDLCETCRETGTLSQQILLDSGSLPTASAKAKLYSAKPLPSAALGKEHTAKN